MRDMEIFRISVFKEDKQKFYIVFIFLFNKAGKNSKTICACTESTDIILFKGLKKCADPIPLPAP